MAGTYFGVGSRVTLRTHDDNLPQTGGEPIGRQMTPDRVEESAPYRGIDGHFERGDAPLSRAEIIDIQGKQFGCNHLLATLKRMAKEAPK